jgi:hypothetical protein
MRAAGKKRKQESLGPEFSRKDAKAPSQGNACELGGLARAVSLFRFPTASYASKTNFPWIAL